MTAPPREPTVVMTNEGVNVMRVTGGNIYDDVRAMWRAMHDAAPAPSADKPKRKRCEHDRWPGDDCDICPAPTAAQPAEPPASVLSAIGTREILAAINAEPPAQAATDDLVRVLEINRTQADPYWGDLCGKCSDALQRQAREIARRSSDAAWGESERHMRERAEAERDALRECVNTIEMETREDGQWGLRDVHDCAARAKVKMP